MSRSEDMRSSLPVRSSLALAVLIAASTLVAPAAGDRQSHSPFYFSDGMKIPLTPSPRYVAVRLVEPREVEELAERLDSQLFRDLPHHDLTLQVLSEARTASEMGALLDDLRSHVDVELVAPVFEAPGALMIVTERLVARVASGVSEEELGVIALRHRSEVVERARWDERTYLLRALDGDSLEAANSLHRDSRMEYAHPDFVRVLDHKRLHFDLSDGPMVLGPDGRRVPPTTELRRGAPDYRMMERAVFDRPEARKSPSTTTPTTRVTRETIKNERFEGAFPNNWQLFGAPRWDDVTLKSYSGAFSGYSGTSPPGPYPKTANTWMVYGPFDLSDAKDARTDMQAWVDTRIGDVLFLGASWDGTSFTGFSLSGNWASAVGGSGWMNVSFDLRRDAGRDLTGYQSVWFAVALIADGNKQVSQGAYVDDFVLEQITGGYVSLGTPAWADYQQWSLNNTEQNWGVEGVDVAVLEAWTLSRGTNKLVTAIIDDGVADHSDLYVLSGYDATGNGSGGHPIGDEAHGTATAGIVTARPDTYTGITDTAILPVRVIVGGATQDSWLADGISWASENGADVLNNGWSGGLPSTAITNAIVDATTNGRGGRGTLVVFPAGDRDTGVHYPANLPETLAVGALSGCDGRKLETSCDGEFWWSSNFGSQLDLVAPGVNMHTTDIEGSAGYASWDYYHDFGGSAAGAALVSGTAILMLTIDPAMTDEELMELITSSADDIGAPGFDNQTGHGRLNAYEALQGVDLLRDLTISLDGTGSGTVTSNPGNINCGSVCNETYFRETVVQLTAVPTGNSSFIRWEGASDCADGQVTMSTDIACTAVFDLPTHLLSVSKSGLGTGTVVTEPAGITCGGACSAAFTEGWVVELFGYPDPGYQLDDWSGHADCVDGSLTIQGPVSCVANFNPCLGSSVFAVPPQTVVTSETFEACNLIQIGTGGFQISSTGDVTLSAGNGVEIANGFEVLEGGLLTIVTGAPVSP